MCDRGMGIELRMAREHVNWGRSRLLPERLCVGVRLLEPTMIWVSTYLAAFLSLHAVKSSKSTRERGFKDKSRNVPP